MLTVDLAESSDTTPKRRDSDGISGREDSTLDQLDFCLGVFRPIAILGAVVWNKLTELNRIDKQRGWSQYFAGRIGLAPCSIDGVQNLVLVERLDHEIHSANLHRLFEGGLLSLHHYDCNFSARVHHDYFLQSQ